METTSRHVLITGAGGFIGSHLTNLLVGQCITVRAMVRSPDKAAHLHPQAQRVVADMHDPDSVRTALRGVDTVYHLAGVTVAPNAEGYNHGNADTARILADALKDSGVRRLVFVSSLAAAGPCSAPEGLTEDDAPGPVSDYGRSKLAAEKILLSLDGGLHVTVVRPPAVYGPRDVGFLPLFRAAKWHVLPVHGFSPVPMSVIHAADLVTALHLAATGSHPSGRVYHVSDGVCRSWADIARTVARALEVRAFVIRFPLFALWPVSRINGLLASMGFPPAYLNPDKFEEARCSGWSCNPGRAIRELNFSPTVELESGMKDCADWYHREGWL